MRDVLREPVTTGFVFDPVDTVIYGLGAQKAGTTWLYRYFAEHPQMHVPPAKEMHYWSGVRWPYARTGRNRARRDARSGIANGGSALFRARRPGIYRAGKTAHADYAALMTLGVGEGVRAVADISPSYANLRQETFVEMAAQAADPRFLYVLRDPVDRLWAGLRHHLRHERGRFATKDVLALWEWEKASGVATGEKFSRYDLTFQALDGAGLADRVHVMIYEEMFEQVALDRFCDALGLDRHPGPLDMEVNVNRAGGRAMPEAFRREARDRLAPVYEFCAARLGRLPAGWLD